MKRLLLLAAAVFGVGAFAGAIRRLFRPYPLPAAPGRMIEVGGERVHVVERGEGRPLILIHGFAGNTFSWRYLLESPPAGWRLIAVDLPGWGFSDRSPRLDYSHQAHARRIVALMDALGIESAVVAGHSMGGGIAQRLAAGAPERVDQLVLVGSVDASESMRRPNSGRAAQGALKLAQRSAPLMFWAGRRGLKQCVYDTARVDDVMVRGYIEPLLLPGTVEAMFSMSEATQDGQPADLSLIKCPTLVVTGAADRVVPPRVAEALHGRISGSDLVRFEQCGHLVAEELADRFESVLTNFLVGAGY